MNSATSSFVLGYHGCDRQLAEKIISGRTVLASSTNDYDWLGDGIYFWEHNALRAFEFADEVARNPHPSGQKISSPGVVGAIIDLGLCLNLLDSLHIKMVKSAFAELVEYSQNASIKIPRNSGGIDLRKRDLDCAVIRTLHQSREQLQQPPFDTIRAAFIEGDPLYENAGFRFVFEIVPASKDIFDRWMTMGCQFDFERNHNNFFCTRLIPPFPILPRSANMHFDPQRFSHRCFY